MSDRVQDTPLQCLFSVVSHHDVDEAKKEIHLLETVNHSISGQLSDEKKAHEAEKKAHKATQRQMASISANAQKEIAKVLTENAQLRTEMQVIKETFREGH